MLSKYLPVNHVKLYDKSTSVLVIRFNNSLSVFNAQIRTVLLI